MKQISSVNNFDMTKENSLIEEIISLCKRRGFVFQSSEIYGGLNGFFDYGPLGVELRKNIKDAWWEDMVRRRDDMVGLDSSIIMNPEFGRRPDMLMDSQIPWLIARNQKCDTGPTNFLLPKFWLMGTL